MRRYTTSTPTRVMPRANGTARNYSNSSSLSPGTWREKCRWDYDAIAATVADLRRRFSPPLTVGLGIEVDYQPQFIDEPLTYLDGHEFDVVLLSVHWAGGRALHLHRRWQELTAATMLDDYLAAMLSAAELCRELAAAGRRPFDIISHFDYVKRYLASYSAL